MGPDHQAHHVLPVADHEVRLFPAAAVVMGVVSAGPQGPRDAVLHHGAWAAVVMAVHHGVAHPSVQHAGQRPRVDVKLVVGRHGLGEVVHGQPDPVAHGDDPGVDQPFHAAVALPAARRAPDPHLGVGEPPVHGQLLGQGPDALGDDVVHLPDEDEGVVHLLVQDGPGHIQGVGDPPGGRHGGDGRRHPSCDHVPAEQDVHGLVLLQAYLPVLDDALLDGFGEPFSDAHRMKELCEVEGPDLDAVLPVPGLLPEAGGPRGDAGYDHDYVHALPVAQPLEMPCGLMAVLYLVQEEERVAGHHSVLSEGGVQLLRQVGGARAFGDDAPQPHALLHVDLYEAAVDAADLLHQRGLAHASRTGDDSDPP